jgi:hypothetical protein
MINTIAETIVWIAKERIKTDPYKNLISAIHAVSTEVGISVGSKMLNILEAERDHKSYEQTKGHNDKIL